MIISVHRVIRRLSDLRTELALRLPVRKRRASRVEWRRLLLRLIYRLSRTLVVLSRKLVRFPGVRTRRSIGVRLLEYRLLNGDLRSAEPAEIGVGGVNFSAILAKDHVFLHAQLRIIAKKGSFFDSNGFY